MVQHRAASNIDRVTAAISDPTRRAILERLSRGSATFNCRRAKEKRPCCANQSGNLSDPNCWPITQPSLELQAKRELQVALALPGAAAALREYFAEGRGVGGVETNIGCAAATAVAAPIRMIPDIVSFGAELEAKAFVDGNGLEQAHVPVLVSGLVDKVANPLGVEGARRRRGEDRRAIGVGGGEPLAPRTKCADDLGITLNNPILAVHTASEIRV
jgi:hypothetical protein